MPPAALNFVEAYRIAHPSATCELVAAREHAFKIIKPEVKSTDRVHDLCRLAFHMPFEADSYSGWFDKPISDADPHFVISQDAAEAGRMATVVLRDLVAGGGDAVALSVLAASYAGRRATFDKGELVARARDLISQSARRPKIRTPTPDLSFSDSEESGVNLAALDSGLSPPNVKVVLEDIRSDTSASVDLINKAYDSLRRDSIRLAEEVDMLWSHIGDWSNILDVPRSALPPKSLPMVSGIDLGAMVGCLPGPYGVYGIIQRTLGKRASQMVVIEECIAGLEATQIVTLAYKRAPDIFPIHKALELAARGSDWTKAFDTACPDLVGQRLSQTEVATQAYRERTSMVFAELVK
jgi:hypothetical protein